MRLSLGTNLFKDYFGKFMALWPYFDKVSFLLFLCLFNNWFMISMRLSSDGCTEEVAKQERSERVANSREHP